LLAVTIFSNRLTGRPLERDRSLLPI
jgi:hypothetical protein